MSGRGAGITLNNAHLEVVMFKLTAEWEIDMVKDIGSFATLAEASAFIENLSDDQEQEYEGAELVATGPDGKQWYYTDKWEVVE